MADHGRANGRCRDDCRNGLSSIHPQVNTEVSIRFAAEDSALAVATKRVASIDHPDPTNPSYKLLPDSVATQLTLSRPHLKEAGATDGAGGVVVEAAKTGRSKCRCCMEPIAQGDMRVGMESWMVGRQVVVWQHPKCFLSQIGICQETSTARKCKQTKKALPPQ